MKNLRKEIDIIDVEKFLDQPNNETLQQLNSACLASGFI